MAVAYFFLFFLLVWGVWSISGHLARIAAHNARFQPEEPTPDIVLTTLAALYSMLPRGSCPSSEPDGCPVCVARAILVGSGLHATSDSKPS